MTDTAREQLVAKVRRIMALAEDLKATDGERSLAAERVAKLMAKYSISTDDLRTQTEQKRSLKIVRFRLTFSNSHGLGSIRADAMARAVVLPFGGRTLRNNPKYATDACTMTVFIREDLRDAAEVLMHSLLLQMESALTPELTNHLGWWKRDFRRDAWIDPTSSQVSAESKTFRRSFYERWGSSVGRRVATARKEALEEARQQAMADAFAKGTSDGETLHQVSTALVLVDTSELAQDAMEQYYEAKWGKKPKAGRRSFKTNEDGDTAGMQQARKADIGLTRLGRQQKALG